MKISKPTALTPINLKLTNVSSKVACQGFFQIKESDSKKFIGKTEVLDLANNIDFEQRISVVFELGGVNCYIISLNNENGQELANHMLRLSELVCISETMVISLTNGNRHVCTASIVTEISENTQTDSYRIYLKGSQLKNIEWRGYTDPFIRIYRPGDSYLVQKVPSLINEWILVSQTIHIDDDLNPDFGSVVIPTERLCKGYLKAVLKFEIWDFSPTGKHVLISTGYEFFDELLTKNKKEIATFHQGSDFAGNIQIGDISKNDFYSIVDYMKAGLNISLSIAIDFTGSNLPCTNPRSLHYLSSSLNPYQLVIEKVGAILEDFDSEKMIPVYGFGAACPSQNMFEVNHCFPINLSDNHYCHKISGVLNAYRSIVDKLEFLGPTYFSIFLQETIEQIKRLKYNSMNYFIVLIITDGLIVDINETKKCLSEACHLPLSIVIVGVGENDFENMEILDQDKLLSESTITRDILQFVRFDDHKGDPDRLAAEVLYEIPYQVSSFYSLHNIIPGGKKI